MKKFDPLKLALSASWLEPADPAFQLAKNISKKIKSKNADRQRKRARNAKSGFYDKGFA